MNNKHRYPEISPTYVVKARQINIPPLTVELDELRTEIFMPGTEMSISDCLIILDTVGKYVRGEIGLELFIKTVKDIDAANKAMSEDA